MIHFMTQVVNNVNSALACSQLPTVSVFIATSLDGFIARKDGSLDWLDRANSVVPPGEDCGYRSFMETVDVLVMGRYSFEKIRSFPQWPYGSKNVIVLSSHPVEIPIELRNTVTCSSLSPFELVESMRTKGAKHLYIDGGITIQRFLEAGLINFMTITLVPVLLGEGRPLFGSLPKDVPLTHVSSTPYDFGFLQVKYRVNNR